MNTIFYALIMSAHLKNKNIAPNFKLEKSEALKDNLLKALKVNF